MTDVLMKSALKTGNEEIGALRYTIKGMQTVNELSIRRENHVPSGNGYSDSSCAADDAEAEGEVGRLAAADGGRRIAKSRDRCAHADGDAERSDVGSDQFIGTVLTSIPLEQRRTFDHPVRNFSDIP